MSKLFGVSVSETIDAHVAVNGRGPPRSGGRDRAFRPVVSDTDTPKSFREKRIDDKMYAERSYLCIFMLKVVVFVAV